MRGKRPTNPKKSPPPKARAQKQPPAPPPADPAPVDDVPPAARALAFPVAGLGASAGGVEALRSFFGALPRESGVAFVIVQHLDPTHKSNMAELLRQDTQMPVVEAKSGTAVEVDHVYVIPPNAYLVIRHGALQLRAPGEPRGMRMPIDVFLRSLAEDQQERSICIVLSGNGTDGTLGLKAVKAAGGIAMAQEPRSAEYDGMPRSAVATNLVDFVQPPPKLAQALVRYARHPYLRRDAGQRLLGDQENHLQSILSLLRSRTNYDFTSYKKGTLARRVERRMGLNNLHKVQDYVEHLRSHPTEVKDLFKDLLISVTSFFREPEAWQNLAENVVARLTEDRRGAAGLRMWVPGCATGEEAYSLAMLVLEQMQAKDRMLPLQIFASDLDADALEFARAGVYPESIEADVPPERLRRFFVRGENTYRVHKQLRETVVFAAQNLISDPPFSRLDVITCRNLLIYLEPEVQQKVITLFHFALRDGGGLFLGNAESIGARTDLFSPVSKKWRIYRRLPFSSHDRPDFPVWPQVEKPRPTAAAPANVLGSESKVAETVQAAVLERYVPGCAVVNVKHEILYLYGRTDQFLMQPTGRLGADLPAWTREDLRTKVRGALREAERGSKRVVAHATTGSSRKDRRVVRITVEPLLAPREAERLTLVVFEEERASGPMPAPPAPGDDTALQQMEYEMNMLREELRTRSEQFETSNEEFKSANEEMMSMNEELQSTNEELETSKEELQSLNEELGTVNVQLEGKVQELEATNDDLQNLLGSTSIATIFLDRQFRLKRFTPATTQLLPLLPSDLRRPISDFAQKFTDRRLIADAEQVLTRLSAIEAVVQTDAGQWYLRRILPYRTQEDRIDGVVVTFTDITALRRAEQERTRLAAIVESSNEAILGKTLDGTITSWNHGAELLYGYTGKDMIGRSVDVLIPTELAAEGKRFLQLIGQGQSVPPLETRRRRQDGSIVDVLLTVSPVYGPDGREVVGASACATDITQRKQAEAALRRAQADLEAQVAQRTSELTETNRLLQQEILERGRLDRAKRVLLRRLATSQDEERRRISRELHDRIGQDLVALKLRLGTIPAGDARVSAITECRQMVDQIAHGIHELAVKVRPGVLEDLGLEASLRAYVSSWGEHHGLAVDFQTAALGSEHLPSVLEEIVYRVLIEALANVQKHAQARRARVLLERRGEQLLASVEDDGVGFDAEAMLRRLRDGRQQKQLGLIGMEERVASVNGTLAIQSKPGAGTTVLVRVPIADLDAGPDTPA